MTEEELINEMSKHYWYHTIPINDRISTPGDPRFLNSKKFIKYYEDLGINFSDKDVLDIACYDGLFSFDVEKKGANRILAIDYIVSIAKELLIPYLKSKVEMERVNIYNLDPEKHGKFDIVLFPGVLYHMRYPFWGIKKVSDMVKDGGELLVETAILSNNSKQPFLHCPAYGEEGPYNNDSVTFFNIQGLKDTLRSFGFIVKDVTLQFESVCNENFTTRKRDTQRAMFYCVKDESTLKQYHEKSWSTKPD
jgi:2-polyprenyl-3-methyl-5-hydroxy-6-metoxy-1,4-benzoquinol methylase